MQLNLPPGLNAFCGDGGEVEDSARAAIREAYRRATVSFARRQAAAATEIERG